jgi:hypothetical protein
MVKRKIPSPCRDPNPRYYKGKRAKLYLWFLTEHHAMKAYWGSGGIAPRIIDIGARWR